MGSSYLRLLLIAALVAWDLGCDKPTVPQARPATPISIVATAYPLADIARQIAGSSAKCDWIAEQGQALDAIDPTTAVLDQIRQADLVLTSGQGEEWAVKGFDDPMRSKSVLRLDLLAAAKPDSGCRQLWLDPMVAKGFAAELAQRLALKRPQEAGTFRDNATKLSAEIDHLMAVDDLKLGMLRGRKVLVLSTDYSALTRSLGLIEVQPVTVAPLRLSDDDLRALRQAIQTDSPVAMLVEVGLPPAVQQDLVARLNIPVIALDSLGTSSGVGRNTYQAILRYDLDQLSSMANLSKLQNH